MPTSRTLAAIDLDRTLIYSTQSMGDVSAAGPLRVVEIYDGAPLSRMTERAWALLRELMDRGDFVPVTTRSTAQYQRIEFPRTPRQALCSNGGTLLVDGRPDPDWAARTREIAALAAPLAEVRGVLDAVAEQPWVKLVRDVEDLFCYLVAVQRDAIPDAWVDELREAAAAAHWSVSVQGRKVYAVPDGISKGHGLVRLRELIGAGVHAIASGDSLLDAPLLVAADRAIRPRHGELHDAGWTADGVAVTARAGVLAGEEILEWALAQVEQHRNAAAATFLAPS